MKNPLATKRHKKHKTFYEVFLCDPCAFLWPKFCFWFGQVIVFILVCFVSGLAWAQETNLNYRVLVPMSAYHGKNGTPEIVRLKDGKLFVTFLDACHHWSLPTPMRDHMTRLYYESLGMAATANVNQPKGSRIMGMWSSDEGKTWTEPIEIIDNPGADMDFETSVMSDGTVVICMNYFPTGEDIGWSIHQRPFVNPVNKTIPIWFQKLVHTSRDGGRTWSEAVKIPDFLEEVQGSPSPVVEVASGDWVLTYWGNNRSSDCAAVVASTDRGKTWKLRSIIDGVIPLDEAGMTRLADGRLIACWRPYANRIFESSDEGRNWKLLTEGKNIGKQEWPGLYETSDRKVILFGGGAEPRLTWTRDFKTWYGPFFIEKDRGNAKVRGVELKDGSLLCVWHYEPDRRRKETRIAKVKLSETGLEVTLL